MRLTSGEKDSIIKSKEPNVIHHDEWTEETTVYVNESDVFATMILLEVHQQCFFFVYYAKKWASLYEWKDGVSPSLIQHGIVIRASLRTMPIVAV